MNYKELVHISKEGQKYHVEKLIHEKKLNETEGNDIEDQDMKRYRRI